MTMVNSLPLTHVVGVDVGVEVGVVVGAEVGVDVGAEVGVDVGLEVGVGVGTEVRVGVGVGLDESPPPHPATPIASISTRKQAAMLCKEEQDFDDSEKRSPADEIAFRCVTLR
ncbi:MAG: hypothetical protein ACREQ4_07205 [Candidatus Binataceae bacterium]